GQSDLDLARRDELGEQHVALAHVGPELRELPEIRQAGLGAPLLDERRHPLGVGRLDPDAALPLRVEEAEIVRRQLLAPHFRGVVGDDEEIHAVGDPHAVLRHRGGRQVGEVGRVELGEELLARHHLHLRGVRLDDVDREAARARLGDCALHHLLADRPPQLHLDAGLLFERLRERARLGGRERGVERERAVLGPSGSTQAGGAQEDDQRGEWRSHCFAVKLFYDEVPPQEHGSVYRKTRFSCRPRPRPRSRTITSRKSAAPSSSRTGARTAAAWSARRTWRSRRPRAACAAASTWDTTATRRRAASTRWCTRSTPAPTPPSTATRGTRSSSSSRARAGARSTACAAGGSPGTRSTFPPGAGIATATTAPGSRAL